MKNTPIDYSPVVILPGINHSPTYVYNSDGSPRLDSKGKKIGGTLLFADVDCVKEKLPLFKKKLAKVILTQQAGDLEKQTHDLVSSAFHFQRCDEEGNIVENLKTKRWQYPLSKVTEDELNWFYRMVPMQRLVEQIGKDKVYMFTFNLVGDPMKSAEELNKYIQMVKEQTGHKKITLLPISLGGTILTAYLDKYGHGDVCRITNIVACLDGTDIAADIFKRSFNVSDEYLHHKFLADIMAEEKGKGTLGYIINSLMHILPKKGFNALLSGAITGVLDTVILNCPEVWAMLPSYEYEELKEKYLKGENKKILCEKTDRFQKARLNLKENLLSAKADGVKIDFISGSNLDFGGKQYSFFGAVKSAHSYNTDGIIGIHSTTLGATGAVCGEKLPPTYKQKISSDYSYISPDNMIDASTALMPDNTWIFLDQHHEVGNNDAVLNVAKAIITGEIENIHSDPENYPQFNKEAHTIRLRRWRIADGERALEDINKGKLQCVPAVKESLQKAVVEAKVVVELTVGDKVRAEKAESELNGLLYKLGRLTPPPKNEMEFKDRLFEKLSEALLKALGGGSLADKIFKRK